MSMVPSSSAGPPFDHGPVGFADLAVLKQKAQRCRRLAVAAEHEAARGVLVQPVGQHRRSRQAETQRVEGILQIGATLGAAMHRQAGRLVDDQHQAVAMEHAA
ncbi:alpha-galactosidase [Bradyrhizobium yuanmingense]